MSTISKVTSKGNFFSRTDRITKVLLIIGFALILLSLYIVAISPAAQGYEISIYDDYPIYFWCFIIISIFIGQFVLILNAFSDEDYLFSCSPAIVSIIIANAILIFIPLIRRYAIYGDEDPESHVGYMLDILRTGHIGANVYPIAHILAVNTFYFSGIDLKILTLMYPFIFYLIFVLSIFLTFRLVMGNRFQILLGMSIAPLLLFGFENSAFLPNDQANSLAQLLLFLLFHRFSKKNLIQYELMIVVLAMVITFYHPLVCLILAVIFIIADITYYIMKRFNLNPGINFRNSSNLTLIILAIYFIWQTYAYILLGRLKKIYTYLSQQTGGSPFSTYTGIITEARPPLLSIMKQFIFMYGIYCILIALSTLGVMIIIYAWKGRKRSITYYEIVFITSFLIFTITNLASNFLTAEVSLGRIGLWAMFTSLFVIPFASIILARPKPRGTIKNILIITLAILLLSLSYLSVFTVHPSPLTRLPGSQVTFGQLDGGDTFFKIRSEEPQIIELGLSIRRLHDALYGVFNVNMTKNVIYYPARSIPDHFGYTNVTYFGDYYDNNRYFVLDTLGRIYYPKIYPEFTNKWRDNRTDFDRLENDISVAKFYTNNEMEIYLLHPVERRR